MEEDLSSFVLGIDLGTTSVKVCLLETKDGSVLKELTQETEADVESIGSEQEVRKIMEALELCVESLGKTSLERVVHIGVCGQMHGVCMWTPPSTDLQRRHFGSWKVSNLYTWMDRRCDPSFLDSLPKPDSHLKLSSGHGTATLFWLARFMPELISEFQCAGTIMDFFVSYLCSLSKPLMSVQNGASWGYCNTEKGEWNSEILQASNFPVHLLPNLSGSGVGVAGSLSRPWFGIPAGTSVGLALGDLQCAVYSTLLLDRESLFVNFSTSAQIGYLAEFGEIARNTSEKIQYFPYFEQLYFAVGASLNGGNVLASFVELIQNWTKELDLKIPKDKIWSTILRAGRKVRETDLEIVATPFGERHDSEARASVQKITPKNAGLGDVTRSLCQGLVNNLADFLGPDEVRGKGFQGIVACGSALSRNPILEEELRRKYGVGVEVRDADAARGVAAYFWNLSKKQQAS